MPRFVINPPVFFSSVAITVMFLGVGALFPNQAESIFAALQSWILGSFGWLYLLAVGIFIFSVLLFATSSSAASSSAQTIRCRLSLSVLDRHAVRCGMGIGLMYFAVGEPIKHFVAPPEAAPLSVAAQRQAMSVTFFHWGLHAWAIYAVSLSLAYFGYRYNLPLTVRSGLFRCSRTASMDRWACSRCLSRLWNIVCIEPPWLRCSSDQCRPEILLGIPNGITVQLILIIVITAVATVSVVAGLDKGIRRLSELNLSLAILLMIFVLMVGPTSQLLRDFVQNIGFYLDTIVLRTFNIYAYEPRPWIDAWTLFYWAWWISWSPFVGMFIARISRGRTVREFVIAVLFIPAGFTFFWMTVFGNTALYIDTTIAGGALHVAVADDLSVPYSNSSSICRFPHLPPQLRSSWSRSFLSPPPTPVLSSSIRWPQVAPQRPQPLNVYFGVPWKD